MLVLFLFSIGRIRVSIFFRFDFVQVKFSLKQNQKCLYVCKKYNNKLIKMMFNVIKFLKYDLIVYLFDDGFYFYYIGIMRYIIGQ